MMNQRYVTEPDDGKVSINGEITWDKESKLYTAWDEAYADPLVVTPRLSVAIQVFEDYCEYLSL